MKKRSLFLLITLILLFVVFTKYNGAIKGFFLDLINPIKIAYNNFITASDSYIQQQENIIKLQKENQELKKQLIEQSKHIDELSKIYKLIPSLVKKPYKSLYIVNTISYVKLNKLNEIILTTPKNFKFKQDKLYGLMQKDTAVGVAKFEENKLYGYLLSNQKSIFSVIIGEHKVNGIAQGDGQNGIIVKYIPRWSKIKVGDIVKTSGLDNIFFPNIPVGVVTSIKNLDTYKSARVKIYADLSNPSIFFLIADATPYLTTDYTPDTSFPNHIYPFVPAVNETDTNNTTSQTKDDIINPEYEKEQDYNNIFNFNLYKQLELKAPIE